MDGVTLYRKIKEQCAGTVALLLTAFAGPQTMRASRRRRARGKVLAKPVRLPKFAMPGGGSCLDQPASSGCGGRRPRHVRQPVDLLRQAGFRVCVAHDLRHAATRINESLYEVIL